MAETQLPSSSEPGLFGRAIGIITAPGATFAHVVASPRPAAILLLVTAVVTLAAMIPQMTPTGRQAILDAQVEAVERFGVTVTDQMYARMEQQAASPLNQVFGLVSSFIVMPIMAIVFTAILWGIFNVVFGGMATFKQVLGIFTHSMVIMALGGIASVPIQLMQSKFSFTGPFNLGALVPFMDQEGFVFRFLSATNAFTLWQIVVLAIGLGVLYKRKSTGITVALTALYLGLVGIGVAVFSAFTGGMGR